MNRTLEQQRAKYALKAVNSQKDRKEAAEYGRHIRRLPAMILNNGLGQALAFLLADDEGKNKPSGEVYKNLAEWTCGAADAEHPRRIYAGNDLIKELMGGDREAYIIAQQETLRLLTWMKKFADAYLPKGGD